MPRAADQSSSRVLELEHKVAVLEVEYASLQQELQEMEARNRRTQKKPSEEANQVLQEHVELEKRYRELTDLLYHKQTQLESMASEKAGLEFQLEKSLKQFREVQVEAERSKATRRSASSWEEDTDIKALEPLPLHHRHMATANHQVFVHLFLMHLLHRLQDFASREGTSAMGDLAHANLP
ncbi:Golgin-84 [Zea mays]|uniref:Golgin-84 n=1 Tax=Zea mays TaxID=4577 RepID=A0A3L6FJI3_MAIZE|nr:Golgin-84 [Zea mays]